MERCHLDGNAFALLLREMPLVSEWSWCMWWDEQLDLPLLHKGIWSFLLHSSEELMSKKPFKQGRDSAGQAVPCDRERHSAPSPSVCIYPSVGQGTHKKAGILQQWSSGWNFIRVTWGGGGSATDCWLYPQSF